MYPVYISAALNVPIFAFDSNGDAVLGLVNGDWTKRISKDGGAFAAMVVTITELEGGWYSVPITALHTDTIGVLSMYFTAAGVKQVNLQYRVIANPSSANFPAGAIQFTYTVTNINTGLPLDGVEVWFSTDNAVPPLNIVWKGETDTFGVARDVNGNKPQLDAGTYYVWRQLAAFTFTDPDVEIVS